VQGMGETFFPSIIQEEIEKEIEIRVFIAEAKFYSMAIFSQNSGRTDVDFRNYDHNKPNRNVPYTLPLKVKSAIKRLMKGLGINTGSVDLIKNKAGEYYFLEVNPSGQYGMVSQPCNFNINRDIAEILIKHNGIT
jgi:glutathione synthase/RimK-type ligase-like ATP-grasp enzyme